MTGTIINSLAIIVGGAVGLLLGSKIDEKLRNTIISGLGIFTLFMAADMFFETQNSIICLSGLVIGTVVGEWLNLESGLEKLGGKVQTLVEQKLGKERSGERDRFIQSFLTTTLLFCIGPMAILGSIQDGLNGNAELLIIKSILDGITSIAFASTMGIGVIFSFMPVLFYQGAITLLAEQAQVILTDAMVCEMTAVGGVLLGGIAISSLLQIKKIQVSGMVPALFIAPFIAWIVSIL